MTPKPETPAAISRERELREKTQRRLVGCAEIVKRLRETGNPDDLADAAFLLAALDAFAEYVGVLRGIEVSDG